MAINSVNSIDAINIALLGLEKIQKKQVEVAESISSGIKADIEAANLSISQNLNANARASQVAVQNAQMGLNLTDMASSTLSQVDDALAQINEIAMQSANGTYSNEQRQMMQEEVDQLTQQVNNAFETKFDDVKVLNQVNSSAPIPQTDISFQVGTTSDLYASVSYDPNITMEPLSFDVSTQTAALNTMDAITNVSSDIFEKQTEIGSVQSQLENSIEINSTNMINTSSALSEISDTDYASAMLDLIKNEINTQALVSVIKTASNSQGFLLDLFNKIEN